MASTKFSGADLRNDLLEVILEDSILEFNPMAEKILTPVKVRKRDGHIPVKFSGNSGVRIFEDDLLRGEKGAYKRIFTTLGDDTFITKVRGIEMGIDQMEDEDYDDYIDNEIEAATDTRKELLIHREKRGADLLFSTTTFSGADDTQAVAALWTDPASKLRQDVNAAEKKIKKKCGLKKRKLSLVITDYIVDFILLNTEFIEAVKYVDPVEKLSDDQKHGYMRQYFNVKEVLIVDAIYNGSPLGKDGKDDAEFKDIWDRQYALLCYINVSGKWGPGVGASPVYTKNTNGKDVQVEDYDMKENDYHWIRSKECRGEKVFKKYGCLLTGVATAA